MHSSLPYRVSSYLIRSDLICSDLVWSDLVWSDVIWSGLILSDFIWYDLIWSGVIWFWSNLIWSCLSDVTQCHVMSFYVLFYGLISSCPVVSCLALSHRILSYTVSSFVFRTGRWCGGWTWLTRKQWSICSKVTVTSSWGHVDQNVMPSPSSTRDWPMRRYSSVDRPGWLAYTFREKIRWRMIGRSVGRSSSDDHQRWLAKSLRVKGWVDTRLAWQSIPRNPS